MAKLEFHDQPLSPVPANLQFVSTFVGRVPVACDPNDDPIASDGVIGPEHLPTNLNDGDTDEADGNVRSKAGGGETIYADEASHAPDAFYPPVFPVYVYRVV